MKPVELQDGPGGSSSGSGVALTAPERRAAIRSLVAELDAGAALRGVTALRHFPAEPGDYRDFPEHIDARLRDAYRRRGVEALYSHQREVLDRVEAGEDVAAVTPTASGKTLCYNAPVLNRILREPDARALYLFPTKALSQDQKKEILDLKDLLGEDVRADVYDGDTPGDARRSIRTRAHIVVTNPDMLHAGILPHHTKWAKLFENLRFVVIDEMHTYRGVFGSHLANLLRRLRRVCAHYGAAPRFILSSATIANPRELAEGLTERPISLVDRSGAPRPERFFLFYNPPVVNPELGIRRSAMGETRRIAGGFLKGNLQTIVFARSRTQTEVLVKYLKQDIETRPDRSDRIRGYRGGYLPKKRREIEDGIKNGSVLGVVSTNALELGIDIGSLDVAVISGYPGTIASTWQQAGRAGRRGGTAAAVLVANSTPINQFVIQHPDYFFEGTPERGLINPENLQVLIEHLKCAAFELPFRKGEKFGDENLEELLGVLEEERILYRAGDRWFWTADSYPANSVSLRSISSDNFVVHDRESGRVIAEVDFVSAHSTLHEKAIYMLESDTYYVEQLDHQERRAEVRPIESDYYTDAVTHTKVTILDAFEAAPEPSTPAAHGEVHVVKQVVGFKKIKFFTGENVGSGELDMPAVEMHTTAFWLEAPQEVLAAVPFGPEDRRDGIRGIRNAMRAVATTFLMCEAHDIGSAIGTGSRDGGAPQPEPAEAGPGEADAVTRIFIYDNYPGGIGFSEPLWESRATLLAETLGLIERCPCQAGCPSCVGPVGEIGRHGKAAALAILGGIRGREEAAPATSAASVP
ncbi:MAG: DEAD/DEAH box helicase [Acidobacteriota bacterium]|nr:DEAD/DEAH box helicase [Acidobacteriota bacterium]